MTEKDFFQFQSEETEQIDIKAEIYKYLRYWYLFIIGIIITLGLAFLYLRYTTPKYTIKSKILLRDDKKSSDFGGGAAFSDFDIFKTSKIVDNEIEVLNAVTLMQRVLTELDLNTSFYRLGRFNDVELYGKEVPVKIIVSKLDSGAFGKSFYLHLKDNNTFVLEEEHNNGERSSSIYKFGQEIQKPYGVFTIVASANTDATFNTIELRVKFHNLRKLAAYYSKQLKIEPVNKNASVLNISLTEPVREKGKDIINTLIILYNREAIEDKNYIASSTLEFIDERLKFLTAELSDVEKGVEDYKRENELTDVSSESKLYVQRASEYNKQLADFEIQLDVLNSIENYLQSSGEQYQLVPSTLSIQDPTLQGLISKFNELQLERERMLRTTQPTNILVQNVNEQLNNLRANILENLKNIKRGLVITRNNLRASTAQFESKIQKVPGIERELLEIQRQQGIKQGLYLYLLQKREESAVALAAAVSDSRVLDPALAGDEPTSPNKMMVFIIALGLGFLFPFAGIFIKNLLNDKVQEIKDVESATATPVIGEICHNDSKEVLVVRKDKREPIGELFNLIRMNMQFSTVGQENRVIMITSSMSGEGKTFFSLNLAASMVITGKKVLIVEYDLRKPKLLQGLGITSKVGVTNYVISDKINIEDIVIPVEGNPGLFVLGCGPIPPNPLELSSSPKVGQLISDLKEKFDHIIFDTAPVGLVADAFTLAPYIDSLIYVVRYGYTYKKQIKIINEIFHYKKLKHPMIVLNDAKKGNGYGYGYGYGYYEKPNKSKKIPA